MTERAIGKVTHYFDRIGAAALELTDELSVGDTIHLKGHTTDFIQRVASIQIEHQACEKVGPGNDIAIKVDERVREGDTVYKVSE